LELSDPEIPWLLTPCVAETLLAEAHNHHFEGKIEQFFKVLHDGLE
jgi:hypothetical protein